MAETKNQKTCLDEEEDEIEPNYKPPAQKSIEEIMNTDANDESLVSYKKSLLGCTNSIKFPNDPRKFVPVMLRFKPNDGPMAELPLDRDLSRLTKEPFVIKEGCKYHLEFQFYVQRDIVFGLKYSQKIKKKFVNLSVSSEKYMVGSYPPSEDLYTIAVHEEDAPTGMLARGQYFVYSKFTDDDGINFLNWNWSFEIKKCWA